ncbi:family 16 glycosylhydrolase [Crateriforma spongiae]|uniref:family 16 glycosylhydrolase n=1 Tax=Crateriforma spongiae TaxID=2724528 RepID=UPI0014484CFC|nr:family 16 glycosylhydrolase [Crateriforma spongiae]
MTLLTVPNRFLFSALAFLFAFQSIAVAEPPTPPEGYRWVPDPRFTDEFDGDQLDADKWYDHHPTWKGRSPAKFMASAVSIVDGKLRIRNSVLDHPDGPYTIAGGAVCSKSNQAHFGYYEVRMKASQVSMSSTFWFSNRGRKVGDRWIAQELDVQETIGGPKKHPNRPFGMFSNTHVWIRENGKKYSKSQPGQSEFKVSAADEFHIYGVWWVDANTAHFYHNDEFQFTLHPDTSIVSEPFTDPMQLNMVTETYNWETPPTPKELSDDTKNATYYDWVHGFRLEPVQHDQTAW